MCYFSLDRHTQNGSYVIGRTLMLALVLVCKEVSREETAFEILNSYQCNYLKKIIKDMYDPFSHHLR